jgi:hypothetical protein
LWGESASRGGFTAPVQSGENPDAGFSPSDEPILDPQALDARELTWVVGHQDRIDGKRVRADDRIERTDRRALLREARTHTTVCMSRVRIERHHLERQQEFRQRRLRGMRPDTLGRSVSELAERQGGQPYLPDRLAAQFFQRICRLPFDDGNAGVRLLGGSDPSSDEGGGDPGVSVKRSTPVGYPAAAAAAVPINRWCRPNCRCAAMSELGATTTN